MEELHERLFDLIESKSFDELSKEEQSFVLEHLSEAEYTLQRNVIAATAALEYDQEEPLALRIPQEKKRFLNRTVPLYQVLIGAASLVLLFLFAGNKRPVFLNWRFSEHPLEISLSNGAASIQTIHDTIIREIPVLQTATSVIHDTVTIVQQVFQQQEKRMLEAGQYPPYPELSEKLLETKSVPFRDDQTSNLLPSVVSTMK